MTSTVRATLVAALAVSAASCGGGGGSSPPPSPPGTNNPPVFSSSSAITVAENFAGVVVVVAATDPEGQALSYSLSGGPDAARFTFTAGTRELRVVTAPNFEAPADAGGNNVYDVSVNVTDGINTVTQNISVTVTNVLEGFRVRRIASGLNQPIFVTGLPDGTGRIVVVERQGRIRVLNGSTGAASPDFLNIAGVDTTGEKGLLSIAFSNNYLTDRTFYVHMNPTSANTTEIRQYKAPAAVDVADASSANPIIVINQPSGATFTNHKGGFLAVDTSNRLLIGLGDGGNGGDPNGNGQNTNTLLGKILRIDPTLDSFPADPDRDYSIPSTNPFAAAGAGFLPEIFWVGVRNPFRGSLDTATNSIFIGDVGQGAIEEVDRAPIDYTGIALNYGWNRREGTQAFNGGADDPTFVKPVAEYGHGSGLTQGNSITGGVVYRGPVTELQGQYIFADFVSENIWTIPVASILSAPNAVTTVQSSAFVNRNVDFLPDTGAINQIVNIGTDTAGNVYFVDLGGEIFRLEPFP